MVRGGADFDEDQEDDPPCCACAAELAELRDRVERLEASLRIAAGVLGAVDPPAVPAELCPPGPASSGRLRGHGGPVSP